MQKSLFIIFGITGDLSQRKLLPALQEMTIRNPDKEFYVLWIGRQETYHPAQNFIGPQKFSYLSLNVTQLEEYEKIKDFLDNHKEEFSEIIAYFAISPDLFIPVLSHLKASEIDKSISKVAFEKPFGFDLQSAVTLNNQILAVFKEEQIYRIDHYLAKEASQNLLAFRFSNSIFEPIWNSKYIDNIQIIASEELWVLNRGLYYDVYWALRDMLQNHILQVLALVTMDMPTDLNASSIKDEKVKAISSLKLSEDFENHVIYGQYEWYRQESWVKEDSRTETFVAMKLEMDSPRFAWIPIYLKTWKALDKKTTKVIVEFKALPWNPYQSLQPISNNKLVFDLWNKEVISLDLNVKMYWESKKINSSTAIFNEQTYSLDGYYRLLLDIYNGEGLLYTRWDMIEQSWKLVDQLLYCKDTCPALLPYQPWSTWPEAADRLLTKDGRKWNA